MPNGVENNQSKVPSYKQEQKVIYLLENLNIASTSTAADIAALRVDLDYIATSGVYSKYPKHYDYIIVTSSNGSGDPLIIEYRLGGSGGTLQFTHTITYDGSGNFQTLTIS